MLKDIDLDQLAHALAEEMEQTDDPDLALDRAMRRVAHGGEPSGFSGPAGRMDEVEFTEDGRPVLLFHKGISYPKSDFEPDFKGVGGPYDTAHQPSIPDKPEVQQFTNLRRKPYEKMPTEGSAVRSFLKKVKEVSLGRNLFFKDVVSTVKAVYPEIKMVFPQPPTYIWNPKEENAKLDIQKIKNNLKIRFPELEWTNRAVDGVPLAQMDFPDGSSMDFTIGENANHLTLTYYKPEAKVQVGNEDDLFEEDEEY